MKAGAQPEQAESLAFLDAWHGTFGTREVVAKEIGEACREGEPDYAAELAEAAGNLSLPPPRGKAGVNTQALGRWLAARKDRPGLFVLREGRRYSGKPARWYVEIGATGTDDAETTEAAVKAMESGDVEPGEPGSMYNRLMVAWELATEKTPAFAAALERAEMRLQDMDLPESLARNRAFWARWMAFASVRAKVRNEGRPEDEALFSVASSRLA